MKALEQMKTRLSYLKREKIIINEAIKELEWVIEEKEKQEVRTKQQKEIKDISKDNL